MKKMTSCVLLIMLLCVFVCGCRKSVPGRNHLDTIAFFSNIKADAWSQNGRKAAYYDGRVYYLSAEDGVQGVYSMAEDGGALRFEFPAEDIRALWVGEEGFLYSGFAGMSENYNGSYRSFRLFSREKDEPEAYDLMVPIIEQEEDEGWREVFEEPANWVWSFYRAGDGTIYIGAVDLLWGGSPVLLWFGVYNGRLLFSEDFTALANQSFHVKKNWEGELNLYARHGILTQHPWEALTPGARLCLGRVFSLYDNSPSVQGLVMGAERLFLSDNDYRQRLLNHWLCRLEDTQAVLAAQRAVVSYDLETNEACLLTRFQFGEQLYNVYNRPNDLLLLSERKWWPRQLGRLTGYDNAGETLYRLDPETGVWRPMIRLGLENAFLHVDDTRAVCAGGSTVYIYDISGDKAVLLKKKDIGFEIVADENKTDIAGNWLFLYGFSRSGDRDELLAKVRLD